MNGHQSTAESHERSTSWGTLEHQPDTHSGESPDLADEITSDAFDEWYREHQWAQNIREGKPFFNGPSPPKPPGQLTPSKLLACPRKTYYSQLNAPEETGDPHGIFWVGSQLEEELLLDFLQSKTAPNQYVTNTLWVSFTEQTSAGEIEIRGATDPVIVSRDAEPVLLTEIKSKRNIDNVRAPDNHHKAQAHAYMRGLTNKHECDINNAIIIYISRTSLDLKPFHIGFDRSFWNDTVLDWAEQYTQYRLDGSLPPANPRVDWECNYCSYKERCGEGEREFGDTPPDGLLPLFEYPRQKLVEYLAANGGPLTPSLAHRFPELADEHDVLDWQCGGCSSRYRWDEIRWSCDFGSPPKCPACANEDTRRYLRGPQPVE